MQITIFLKLKFTKLQMSQALINFRNYEQMESINVEPKLSKTQSKKSGFLVKTNFQFV